MPYTPSRLEWLAVALSARGRVELSTTTGYSIDFVPIENENTILIFVTYVPSIVEREIMNTQIEGARQAIAIESKSRGWSSWLKVREKVEMHELKKH
jgi:hypothetical protein